MNEDSIIARVTWAVAGFTAVAVAASFALWGGAAAFAAAVGGAIAIANWLGLRWVASRARKQPKAMILLAPKTLLVLVGTGVLVVYGSLDLRGLAIGMGGLAIGVVGGALASSRLFGEGDDETPGDAEEGG